MVQPDQNQSIEAPQANALPRPAAQHTQLLTHDEDLWRTRSARFKPRTGREQDRPTNAKIPRCSNTLATLRHVDEVLPSDSVPRRDSRAGKADKRQYGKVMLSSSFMPGMSVASPVQQLLSVVESSGRGFMTVLATFEASC